AATIAVGVPIIAGAVALLWHAHPPHRVVVGAAVFFVCAAAAELKPLSLDVENTRVVSLAFIFVVSAQVLFGWEYGIAVGVGAMLVAQLAGGAPPLRLAFNCSVYAISTFASSAVNLVGPPLDGRVHYGSLAAVVFGEGAVFLAFNVVLVCV